MKKEFKTGKWLISGALLAALGVYTAPAFANGGEDQADPAANWDTHCKKCHGADGAGKTAMGKRFKLRDYTDPEVQATFTDEDIIKVTTEGIEGDCKSKMKPHNDKLSAGEIEALVGYIRAMAKKE